MKFGNLKIQNNPLAKAKNKTIRCGGTFKATEPKVAWSSY
jgi:hypothetical protein